jgi:hypothetical protein
MRRTAVDFAMDLVDLSMRVRLMQTRLKNHNMSSCADLFRSFVDTVD